MADRRTPFTLADERRTLLDFMDYLRESVLLKVADPDDDPARSGRAVGHQPAVAAEAPDAGGTRMVPVGFRRAPARLADVRVGARGHRRAFGREGGAGRVLEELETRGLLRSQGREEDDVADGLDVREQHHQAVDADAEAAHRRHAVLHGA